MSNDFISRTARVPARHYKRRYTISQHAVERFRERVDEQFRHRDDEDLANLLDERLRHSEFTYQVRDPRAPEEITTLRSVACWETTLYAVERNETIVTVLDEAMAKTNFDGQWSPVLNAPFVAALRDIKLPAVRVPLALPAAPAAPAAPVTEDEPAAVDPLAEAGAAYARARKQRYACEQTWLRLKAEVEQATAALSEAELAVEETHQRLIALVEGEPR